MDEKLKVAIVRDGRNVLVKVLEQPEATRGLRELTVLGNGFRLDTSNMPYVDNSTLSIRGTAKSEDNRMGFCPCETDVEADQLFADIRAVVAKFNVEWAKRTVKSLPQLILKWEIAE